MEQIRVLIVDDHLIVQQGLRAILEKEAGLEVVGACASGEEAFKVILKERPDVALVDIRLVEMTGVDLCRRVREAGVQAAVLILTSFLNEDLVRECIQAGARGYLLKDVSELDLVASVRAAAQGDAPIAPKAAALLMDWVKQRPDEGSLTGEDLALLRCIARGMTNKEIAGLLYVSENTVKDRVLDLFRKFRVKGRVEAVMEGVRRGLL